MSPTGWWLLLLLACSTVLSGQSAPRTLQSGWFDRAPYQLEEHRRDSAVVTGFEINLLQTIAREKNIRVEFQAYSWSEQIDRLANGEQDIVIGAYYRADRLDQVRYSVPYREERNTLFLHRDLRSGADFNTVQAFFDWLERNPIRIGTATGYVYSNEDLEQFLKHADEGTKVINFRDEQEMLTALLDSQVDAMVADPLVIATLLTRHEDRRRIHQHPLDLGSTAVHFMFSRATVSEAEVAAFNAVLKERLESGEVLRMQRDFLLPTFLSIATTQQWFFILNLMGIAAFSVSGILLARKGRYNLFGALILAATPAVGGGLVRDLLIGQTPVFFLATPVYMLLVLSLVLLGTLLFNLWDRLRPRFFAQSAHAERWALKLYERLFKIFDAWAVAAFTVIGVSVAAENQIGPLWLWGPVLGVITASFGVILRDMVRADHDILILKRDSYGEISILIGVLYSQCLLRPEIALNPNAIIWTTLLAIFGGFSLRLLIIFRRWPNPFQLGNHETAPERRFAEYLERERQLWQTLLDFIPEVAGVSQPQQLARLEALHNDAFVQIDTCHNLFRSMTREPLGESNADRLLRLQNRLGRLRQLEDDLYSLANEVPEDPNPLDRACWESLRAVIQTTTDTLQDPDPLNLELLARIATADPQRFERLRRTHTTPDSPMEESSIQRSYRFQRLFAQMSEFVNLYVTDRNQLATAES